jgi:hypothetical protein
MPRMPKDPGDQINYAERALAGPISKSALQHLLGLDPPLVVAGPDICVVKRIATIGAFMAAGVPLVPAARIANALSREFDNEEAPSGLKEVAAEEAASEELAALPGEANDYWYHRAILQARCRQMREILGHSAGKLTFLSGAELKSDDYWEHIARLRAGGGYYPGLVPAMASDVRIEICDRRHVFMWPTSRLKSFSGHRESKVRTQAVPSEKRLLAPGFVGWIENWERDTEMRFKHVSEVIQLDPTEQPHTSKIALLIKEYGEEKYRGWSGGDHSRELWMANAGRLQVSAEEVLPNATGRVSVNVSLAIRRALDRIAEHRWDVLRKRDAAKKRPAEAQQ